jgi:hypothetical protein
MISKFNAAALISAAVTVIAACASSDAAAVAPQVVAATSECATPGTGWIWCDDFEQNRRAKYFEYDSAQGAFVRAPAVGLGGSVGMRARFSTTASNAGSLKLAFGKTPSSYFRAVDAGTTTYRDVYWRHYIRTQPGWTGGGGDKLSRATSFASPGWAQAMIAHVWSGTGTNRAYLYIDPASGTDAAGILRSTKYNDFANFRWLGAVKAATPTLNQVNAGQWFCIEAHAKLNSAGASDGLFELWVDGVVQARRTGLNWVGAYSQYGINAVLLENYWNDKSPKVQERYFDNFVVATQRIGCQS